MSTTRRRILVIEDYPEVAYSLQRLLTRLGQQVEVAYTAVEGLEKARTFRPDLVFCDIGLPGAMDGYGAARAFRKDPVLGTVFLVALTGYCGPNDQELARQAGFDLFLVKPPELSDLMRACELSTPRNISVDS